jgi:uncharacterized protein (DUF1778 family)
MRPTHDYGNAKAASFPRIGEECCAHNVLTNPVSRRFYQGMATATEHIHLRADPKIKTILQQAAKATGSTNLTDYILRAAYEKAQSDILNQRVFSVDAEGWKKFNERLDAPPKAHEGLRKFMNEPDVFDAQ